MNDPLVTDSYAGDGNPDWTKLIAAGWPWVGAGLKISEGVDYSSGDWFIKNWNALQAAAGERLGVDFWRYAYEYFRVDEDGKLQAEFALRILAKVGGLRGYDWPLMIDVEGANNPAAPSTAHVVDGVSKFAEVIKAETGRAPILYGNIYLWEHNVRETMGCEHLVVARYTPTLPAEVYERIGWRWSSSPTVKPPTVLGWQYCGVEGKGKVDGDNSVTKYPLMTPIGPMDTTALIVANGGQNAIGYIKANLVDNGTPAAA